MVQKVEICGINTAKLKVLKNDETLELIERAQSGDQAARDEAVAVKLMPALVSALSGKIPRSDRGLGETLDTLFGEEHTALCRKLLKSSGADLL